MTSMIRRFMIKAPALAIALLGFLYVACNVEPEVEYRVDLVLADSLSKDKGKYDSLVISFVHANGDTLQPRVFRGPFLSGPSGGVIKDLLIGNSVPTEYLVVIKAYQGNNSAVYSVKVKDKTSDTLVVVVAFPKDSGNVIIKPKAPEALVLSDSLLTMGIASTPRQIFATLFPDSITGLVLFTSTHPAIATVDENGFITPVAEGETRIIASVSGHTHITDTVLVKVIIPPAITEVGFINPARLLYTGAPGIKLNVSHLPTDLTPVLEFHSSDEGIITVSANGTVTAKAEGSALITVSAVGTTAKDTLTIRSMRDAPFIDAGQTQSVAIGQPVNIKVTVTQAFGTLNLSWDFTGDGQPEDSTSRDTATATHTYNQEGDFTATFTAKDGEGNTTIQTVRIRVGKAGPLVIITSPRNDTLVNNPAFTVRFTSDNIPKSQAFTLLEGVNVLTVRDSNATGKDSAWVKVTLDTKVPVVKITSPANGTITNLPEIDVAWTVDDMPQTTRLKESLAGKQGLVGIVRTFTDSAGNFGRDSITITRDTVPPAAPVFAGGDTTVNARRPTWSWTSGGGGNGTFLIQFGAGTTQEVTSTNYTPALPLDDGIYTLSVRERDAAGNVSATTTKAITVKTAGPGSPTFNNALTTASPTNNKKPTWAWVSSGAIGGGSGYFRWSVTTQIPISDSGVATSFIPATDLPDGTYTLTLQERDALGNWSTAVTRDIRILTQGALVEITSPARGAQFNIRTGVIAVAWEVNGAAQSGQTNHTLTVQGANLIRREFRDLAGNLSFDTLTVIWDTVAPRVAISAPTAGATVNTQSVSVAWTVDGIAQSGQTTENLSVGDGLKAITRTSTDLAGNSGTASVSITLDMTPPAVPTFNTTTTTASPTNNIRPTWAWNGSGPFEYRISLGSAPTGAGTAITGTSYQPPSANPLTEGSWYLQVRERDAVGNWSAWSASHVIVIDVSGPTAPTITSQPTSPTRTISTSSHTWEWGGVGPYEWRLSQTNSTTGTGTAITARTYSRIGTLADGNWYFQVRERDAAGNWSGWNTATLTVDNTAPNAPTVTRNAEFSNAPRWTWSASTTNPGNSQFRYRWNGNSTYLATGVGAGSYAPTGLSETAHNLCVSERDAVDYGAETCMIITVDRTGPSVIITSPASDGFITNSASYTVRYRVDNGAEQTSSCNLTNTNGNNNCTITATDNAQNSGSATRVVVRRSNVVFVRKGVTGGAANGSSWVDAFPELYQALDPSRTWSTGTEIWVSQGSYSHNPSGFQLEVTRSGISVLGGFAQTGFPNINTDRNPTTTPSTIATYLSFPESASGITWSGFTHNFENSGSIHIMVMGNNISISRCRFTTPSKENSVYAAIQLYDGNTTTITDCSFYSMNVQMAAIAGRGVFLVERSSFTGLNTGGSSGPAIHVFGGARGTIRESSFAQNFIWDSSMQHIYMEDETSFLTVRTSTLEDGRPTIAGNTVNLDYQ